MPENVWPEQYWRDARWLAGCLALLLAVAFSPFLFGPFSILSSAGDAPSLYLAGAKPDFLPAHPLRTLDPGAGAWQNEPWLQVEHDALLLDHRIPWWDPYDGYGAPFAAASQPQPFYPLTLLASMHPTPRVWNWFVVARLFVAGLFAAFFVRLYGGRAGALAAGAATSFAGYYLLYYDMPHLSVETLFPAVLWGTEWLVRRPGYGSIAGLGAIVGTIYLGGMPESAAVALVSAALYFSIRSWRREPAPRPFARVAGFVAANVLGLCIGAAMLLPFAEYLPHGVDTHRTMPIGLSFDGYSLVRTLFQKFAPLAYGPPMNANTDPTGNRYSGIRGWFGAGIAAFAFLGFLSALRRSTASERRGPVIALGVLFACGLGKSMGAPWINWIGALPILRLIGFPKYGEVVIDGTAALLCGLGIAAFENGQRPARWAPIAAVGAVGAMLLAGYAGALQAVPPSALASSLYRSVCFATALLAISFGVMTVSRLGKRVPALLAAIVVVEAVGAFYVPMYGKAPLPSLERNPYAGAPYVAAIRAANHDDLRVVGQGGILWPNWAGAMRLDDPEALNGLYPNHYLPFVNIFLHADPASRDLFDRFDGSGNPTFLSASAERWLTLSSVGYIVVPHGRAIADPHFRLLFDGDAAVYTYDRPLPRASIFHRVLRLPAERVRAALGDLRIDTSNLLLLTGVESKPEAANPSTAGESARIIHRDVGSTSIDADLLRPGYVMLNDTFYPGWEATVDGKATTIMEADYLFRAVAVGAGHHRIEYTYRPLPARIGTILTLLGILIAVACGTIARKRARSAVIAPV